MILRGLELLAAATLLLIAVPDGASSNTFDDSSDSGTSVSRVGPEVVETLAWTESGVYTDGDANGWVCTYTRLTSGNTLTSLADDPAAADLGGNLTRTLADGRTQRLYLRECDNTGTGGHTARAVCPPVPVLSHSRRYRRWVRPSARVRVRFPPRSAAAGSSARLVRVFPEVSRV